MGSISAALVTAGSPARLEWWMGRVRPLVDEIIVAVDAAAGEVTVEAARRLADQTYVVELPGFADPARDWLAGRASGEWILMLDDDECLPASCGQPLRALTEDAGIDCYGFPLRWVVRGPDGSLTWLRQHPWHSCHYVRLWRNDPSSAAVPGALHTAPWCTGPCRCLDADGPVVLYHLDLLWRSRAEREAKAARYRSLAGDLRPAGEEFYLWEDYAEGLIWESVPESEGLPESDPGPAAAGDAVGADIALGELRDHLAKRGLPSDLAWDDRWLAEAAPAGGPHHLQWAAGYRLIEEPGEATTNAGMTVLVEVTNAGRAPWATGGSPGGRVLLGTRWASGAFGYEVPMGDVTQLPGPLEPGASVAVEVGVWTPRLPGDYELVVEVLHEGHSWFSQHGVTPLSIPIRVRAGRAPAQVRHFVGRLADDPPEASGPSSIVGVDPLTLYDSATGHGYLPWHRPGPVAAGSPVVLGVAGVGPIPPEATGVILSVLVTASIDGVVRAAPTEGWPVVGTVIAGFGRDGRPGGGSAVVGLGRGRGHGRVTIWMEAARLPGEVVAPAVGHLSVQVSGYLSPAVPGVISPAGRR